MYRLNKADSNRLSSYCGHTIKKHSHYWYVAYSYEPRHYCFVCGIKEVQAEIKRLTDTLKQIRRAK